MPGATAEDRDRGMAVALLALAMVVAAGVLIYWGRDQVMIGDDLYYAERLSQNSLWHAILHSNLYLLALPMVLYKAMFEVFGIGDYLPYRLAAIALSLLCAGLFYAIVRRRIGSLLALAPALLILFFGSGWETLITGLRIPSLFAIAAGLGAVLALEREDRRGDFVAALLLCVSVTSHPSGTGFLAAAAVMIAFRPSAQRWRSAWVAVIPAALFGAFTIFYQRTVPNAPGTSISDVLGFARDSWTTLTAAVTGLSGVLDAPVYDRLLAEIASMALLAVILVGAAIRWQRLRPTFFAAVAGLITLLVAPRLSPGGFLRPPDAPRYLYPDVFLFLWVLVELGWAWRDAWTARVRGAVAGVATVVLLLGVWSNLAKLSDASSTVRVQSTMAEGRYSAYDLERGRLQSSYRPNPFAPTAGNYLSAAAAYGSIGFSPSELSVAPMATRAAADTALVGSLGLSLTPARRHEPARRCAVRSSPAELTLPRGGAMIGGDRLGDATFTLGRFADPALTPLSPESGVRTAAALRIPPDGADVPWRLGIASRSSITVCGLSGTP